METPRGSRVPLIVALGLLGLGASAHVFLFYRSLHPADLDAWVSHVERSGQRLLYSAEKSGHYFAVFDAGGGRLSFCVKDLKPGNGETASSTEILDEQGKDLELKSEPLLETHRLFLIANYVEVQGVILSLRPGYQGSIHLIYRQGLTRIASDGSITANPVTGPAVLDTILRR